jgi:hypothetical protein
MDVQKHNVFVVMYNILDLILLRCSSTATASDTVVARDNKSGIDSGFLVNKKYDLTRGRRYFAAFAGTRGRRYFAAFAGTRGRRFLRTLWDTRREIY